MTDLTAIQGKWVPIKAELAGEAAPAPVLERTEFVLTADRYLVRFGGEVSDQGHYTLGAETGVKSLRLDGTAGPNCGRSIPALYQLAGDRLRVCYGLDGTLPPGFATARGTQLYLVTYRRA